MVPSIQCHKNGKSSISKNYTNAYFKCRKIINSPRNVIIKPIFWWEKKQFDANSTQCSQAVTHPSTNRAQHCLTSVIGRELVCSMWYGRWREVHKKLLLYYINDFVLLYWMWNSTISRICHYNIFKYANSIMFNFNKNYN